jgi:hypothetical protein
LILHNKITQINGSQTGVAQCLVCFIVTWRGGGGGGGGGGHCQKIFFRIKLLDLLIMTMVSGCISVVISYYLNYLMFLIST